MKKIRGLRRHYRNLKKRIEYCKFHLDEEDSWYNFWHFHAEGKGISNMNLKHRRNHLKYLFQLLNQLEIHSKTSILPFQTWIYIDSESGTYDALFIHTPNPNSDFPVRNNKIEWGLKTIPILKGIINKDEYLMGKSYDEYGTKYYINKKGLGRSLDCIFEDGNDIS